MKPGCNDHRHKLLICGDRLRELKKHTGDMAEAFGLGHRECLRVVAMGVIAFIAFLSS